MSTKTNAMRILDKAKVPYGTYSYDCGSLNREKLHLPDTKIFGMCSF